MQRGDSGRKQGQQSGSGSRPPDAIEARDVQGDRRQPSTSQIASHPPASARPPELPARFDPTLPTLSNMQPSTFSQPAAPLLQVGNPGQIDLATLAARPPASTPSSTGQIPAIAPAAPAAQTGAPPQGATLGVRSAMAAQTAARIAAIAGKSQPTDDLPVGREPTLTAQMRAVQPPDVARQAISELTVLASELASLPRALEESGLAPTHAEGYFEAAEEYLRLATVAWESVAQERLEQSGADAEYRQRAIFAARRISQLRQECRTASGNDQFQLPRRTPALWRRRVGLISNGLRAWQASLSPTPDTMRMGRGLYLLRGALGLAAANAVPLILLDVLIGAAVALLTIGAVGLALLSAASLLAGTTPAGIGLASAALAVILAAVLVPVLGARGPAPLAQLLGASVYATTHSTRNAQQGASGIATLLRGWWLLIGLLAVGALAAALVASGLLLASGNIVPRPDSATLTLSYAGGAIALGSGLAAAVSFVALALLFTPVLLVAIGRLVAEMGANPAWVPAARRYAIGPALALLAPLTAALLIAAWAVANALSWQGSVYAQTTLTTAMASIPLHLTLRSLVFLAVLVVPYLLLLSLPFRVGMSRWRHAWLKGLAARRAEVESHVRRLSATDPRSGTQDTSEENLRSMQYDLVLLQFYRDKIAEAGKTRSAPIAFASVLATLILAAATALILDNAVALLHLFVR